MTKLLGQNTRNKKKQTKLTMTNLYHVFLEIVYTRQLFWSIISFYIQESVQ